MRVLVTGGSGVLGRALLPLLGEHDVVAPGRTELDLFDAEAVRAATADVDAVVHLATRIGDWPATDRLRTEAARHLVDGALAGRAEVVVVPTVAFVLPPGAAEVPSHLRSALEAERQVARVTEAGRRGVALRLGLLFEDRPDHRFGAALHVDAAGAALRAALRAPGGTYTVTSDEALLGGASPLRSG